jgi:hypothetical protein
MRRLAILIVLTLEFALVGCANNNPSTTTSTSTSGNWEAQLINPTGGQASLLNFVVSFNVTNSGPLDIKGFTFFNQNGCFASGTSGQTESGNASFTTDASGNVTGTLDLTVTSASNGTVLTLKGNLTGKSSATNTTSGTLSSGVVVGTWTLSPGSNSNDCNAVNDSVGATFVMCQNAATCSAAEVVGRPQLFVAEVRSDQTHPKFF